MTTPSWTSGYVGDINYTLGFYREIAPAHLDYACVINGYAGLPQNAGLRYCELGCGLGFGTALLAAANPDISFVGIDFNPSHVAEARSFAKAAAIDNVEFFELNFEDAARSGDPLLADFNIVAMHGVYSWVSPEVRDSIHNFLRIKLAPGGIVYNSYNTYPGWASAAPVQKLLKEFADRVAGDSRKRIGAGFAALKTLVDKESFYATQNPGAKQRIEQLERQGIDYIAHEYLNENWQPFYVTEAMASIAEGKVTYVGSATIGENRLNLCVPAELIPLVESAPDIPMRELLKDYAINKQFRRDIYIKGPTRISGTDLQKRYDELAFVLPARPKEVPESWAVPVGSAKAKPQVAETILELLGEGPAYGKALRAGSAEKGFSDVELAAAMEILVHNGIVSPCRSDFSNVDRTPSQRVNQVVFDLALKSDTHRFLAAPVLGSAISATYFERLSGPIMIENGGAKSDEVASLLLDRIEKTAKGVQRNGKPLQRNEETKADLAQLVDELHAVCEPRWRAVGVMD